MAAAPTFYVVPGTTVKRVIDGNRTAVFRAVETAYRLHAAGDAVNPDSYFLRFPDKPNARIIALPAHLGGAVQKSGIKWISSFPDNRAHNLARASAVLILNDARTGYPVACIEAALISATRTAASAALAAEHLSPDTVRGHAGVVGTGVIARTTIEWLLFRNWQFRRVNLYDLDREEAERLRQLASRAARSATSRSETASGGRYRMTPPWCSSPPRPLEPYLSDARLLGHCPTVLHLSLRDICVNVILASQNIVDDVDHCLKANTSLHLAENGHGQPELRRGQSRRSFWTSGSSPIRASRAFSRRSGSVCSILRSAISSSRRRRVRSGDRAARLFQQCGPMVRMRISPWVSHISQSVLGHGTRDRGVGREWSAHALKRSAAYVARLELQRVGPAGGGHRGQSAVRAVSPPRTSARRWRNIPTGRCPKFRAARSRNGLSRRPRRI